MFSNMEYFESKLPFLVSNCHVSVNVVHNNCIIERESYSFVFKKFGNDFLCIRIFPDFIEKVFFHRSFCFGGSVYLLFFRCN